MKAIETQYKGYRFRSRLEARWAVFFDALALGWQYEPEGFALPSGHYLPDFFLPAKGLWVEVKGVEPTARELLLAEELADGKDQRVFVSAGLPDVPGWLATPRRGIAQVQLAFGTPEAAAAAKSARFEHGANLAHTMAQPDEFVALTKNGSPPRG